jgi:hypothetical protein
MLIIILLSIYLVCSDQASNLKSYSASFEVHESENTEPKEYLGVCFIKIRNYFYDLNPLSEGIAKQTFTLKNGQVISYNLCKNVKTTCDANQGLVVSEDRCKKYAGEKEIEKKWSVSENSLGNNILTVVLPPGDVCMRNKNGVVYYNTTFLISCDKIEQNTSINFNPSKCDNTISFVSKVGKNCLNLSLQENQVFSLVE